MLKCKKGFIKEQKVTPCETGPTLGPVRLKVAESEETGRKCPKMEQR